MESYWNRNIVVESYWNHTGITGIWNSIVQFHLRFKVKCMKKHVWYNVQKDVVTVQEEYSTVPYKIEGERCIKSIGGVMCGVMYGVILESYWNRTGTV